MLHSMVSPRGWPPEGSESAQAMATISILTSARWDRYRLTNRPVSRARAATRAYHPDVWARLLVSGDYGRSGDKSAH